MCQTPSALRTGARAPRGGRSWTGSVQTPAGSQAQCQPPSPAVPAPGSCSHCPAEPERAEQRGRAPREPTQLCSTGAQRSLRRASTRQSQGSAQPWGDLEWWAQEQLHPCSHPPGTAASAQRGRGHTDTAPPEQRLLPKGTPIPSSRINDGLPFPGLSTSTPFCAFSKEGLITSWQMLGADA